MILGGLSRTAVYKPAFYGFVLAVLVPLIARVAIEGDQVHLFTAGVLGVVLVFVLAFGRQVNDVLTQSLTMRYENVDLIRELKAQTEAALAARAAAETASLAKSQFLAAASHDLRQPLHAMGLFAAALAARVRDPAVTPLVASIRASVEALEYLFAELLDLSQTRCRRAAARTGGFALGPLFARLAADFAPQAQAARLSVRVVPTASTVVTDAVLLERVLRNLLANAVRYTPAGGVVLGRVGTGRRAVASMSSTSGVGIAEMRTRRASSTSSCSSPERRRNHAGGRGIGTGARHRAPARGALRPRGRARVDTGARLALFRDGATCPGSLDACGTIAAHPQPPEAAPSRMLADAASSSSTTILRSWPQCRRCSHRGMHGRREAPMLSRPRCRLTAVGDTVRSARWISSSRIFASPTGNRGSTRLRDFARGSAPASRDRRFR